MGTVWGLRVEDKNDGKSSKKEKECFKNKRGKEKMKAKI